MTTTTVGALTAGTRAIAPSHSWAGLQLGHGPVVGDAMAGSAPVTTYAERELDRLHAHDPIAVPTRPTRFAHPGTEGSIVALRSR